MKCQECHKRPATLHFTQVINGQKIEVNVCELCAKEKGYISYQEDGYSLHNLLTGLFNFDTASFNSPAPQALKEKKCPQCGMTFSQFKEVGKFGCATCYHTFEDRLDPILKRVHAGNTRHAGKIPERAGVNLQMKKRLQEYRQQLQHLVETEAFEEAAKVRDKIREIESNISNNEAGDES